MLWSIIGNGYKSSNITDLGNCMFIYSLFPVKGPVENPDLRQAALAAGIQEAGAIVEN